MYHSRVPFVKQLMDVASNRAQDAGHIRTLLGRRCRFHLWEPTRFGIHNPLDHETAIKEHGPGIKKSFHIQSSESINPRICCRYDQTIHVKFV